MKKTDITSRPAKRYKTILLALAVMLVIVGLFVLAVRLWADTKSRQYYKEDLSANQQKYLRTVSQDKSQIQFFCDENNGSYYVTIYNSSDYIFSGVITLYDEAEKEIDNIEVHFLLSHNYVYRIKEYEDQPYQASIKAGQAVFYQLDFDQPDREYKLYYGTDGSRSWMIAETADAADYQQVKKLALYKFMEYNLTSQSASAVYVKAALQSDDTAVAPADYSYVITFDFSALTVTITSKDGQVYKTDMSIYLS